MGAAARPRPFTGAKPASELAPALEQLAEILAQCVADRAGVLLTDRLPAGPAFEPWLDVKQAAAYLACEPHRVYDLTSAGRLRCAKDGRRSLYRREWLDEHVLGRNDR